MLPSPDEKSVFLNVPFDARYTHLFTALIAGLTALGRKPRCVLEVVSAEDRMDRIFRLIATCAVSIHDLSRVSLSGPRRVPRFNMPFELGVAYGLARQNPEYEFFIFEERRLRLQATLSDLNGHDPHIHGGTQKGVLRCLLDCLGTPAGAPSLERLLAITRALSRHVARLEREHGVDDPFRPFLFRQIGAVAVALAEGEGLLAP